MRVVVDGHLGHGGSVWHTGKAEGDRFGDGVVVVHDVDETAGSGGAVWSLPHGGDLDANLVRLDAGQAIQTHRNDEVDVLIVVRSGSGALGLDGAIHQLRSGTVALVPKGSSRSIVAGPQGVGYLSVHRGRGPLTIGASRPD